MVVPDYYARLEVSPNATPEQIKASYRRLVRLHHPDLNKQAKDTRIKQLNEAYGVLSSVARRAAYDGLRAEEQRAAVLADAIRRQQEAAKRKKAEVCARTEKSITRRVVSEHTSDKVVCSLIIDIFIARLVCRYHHYKRHPVPVFEVLAHNISKIEQVEDHLHS